MQHWTIRFFGYTIKWKYLLHSIQKSFIYIFYSHLIRCNLWYNPMQILDTYNLYLNYCLAYASIIFIQSKMTRGIKLQFISIMVERTKAKSTQSIYFLRILTHIYITSIFAYAQIQRINNELNIICMYIMVKQSYLQI